MVENFYGMSYTLQGEKMSGHSKWDNIKHKKERQDRKKGKLFAKLVKEITVCAREDPDPETNYNLANAIEQAKEANMPKENIEKAIKRATGELEGHSFEEIFYEGYGPGGTAIMIRVVTDNRNRAASEIRKIFEKYGGNMGEEGCVSWIFERKGIVVIKATEADKFGREDLLILAIDLGAEDIQETEEEIEIYCPPRELMNLKQGLAKEGAIIERAEVTMIPKNTVSLKGREAEKVLGLLEDLEDSEDVQQVFANFDVSALRSYAVA